MGHIRYRRSIQVLPGVRLNLNGKSASVSVGGKGRRTTISTNGKTTRSVRIPGTHMTYVDTRNTGSRRSDSSARRGNSSGKVIGIVVVGIAILLGLLSKGGYI